MHYFCDQLLRTPDVANRNCSEVLPRIRIGKPNLLGDKCDCPRRFDARAQRLASVAIQPAGHVNGQYRNARCFHRLDNLWERIGRRAIEARSKNRIDD